MKKLNDLQKTELQILKSFIDVCEKNNLKYYVLGGTCLGAIRHSGFIPWDDDIDVGLPRKDYERLMEVAQKSLPEYYFLQNFKTDNEYPVCFAKIRDSRTTFIESSVKNLHINHGAYIDIFPLDYYPDRGRRLFGLKVLLYKARFSSLLSTEPSLKIKVLSFIAKTMYPNVKKAQKKLNNTLSELPESDNYINVFGAWGVREIVPVSWFMEGEKFNFEDTVVTVPLNYDKYLEKLYGDYMVPPPAKEQVTHHFTEVIDMKKSYINYI